MLSHSSMLCCALSYQIGEKSVPSCLISGRPDVECIDHYEFVVLVLYVLVVHAEANLAEVEILSRELKSMQELIFVWELIALLLLARLNAKLVVEDLGGTRAPRSERELSGSLAIVSFDTLRILDRESG